MYLIANQNVELIDILQETSDGILIDASTWAPGTIEHRPAAACLIEVSIWIFCVSSVMHLSCQDFAPMYLLLVVRSAS